ncbi:GTPase ObgE [Acutalibacter muris]|uniref:GTPase Obg n=1 Tax=Acutalibacter muris TaxID=1796620 RepID=A0A1Z2XMJ0_9FIRM|nr:GTPase ObgE [Acutalibacter muris]ANU53665.1 GTPase CgtA [Hungateiclostridiaceae bacterium KB18]ASB39659.1 GTPase ObgE [Acutalibacter muris]QQR28953.1 GTPase ObgE [Acutalibacter muris]
MFIDMAKIYIKAGDGGDGAVSFHREKYVAAGGPDGGDGGRGGSVVFQGDSNLSTLADFRYKRKYLAPRGENGRGGRCAGKSAQDLVVRVPIGTLVKEAETGRIIADIWDGEPQVIARGGRGGWGNTHFATPTRQAPRFAKPGLPGQELEVQLELKLLADVGLVGFPNVGKSTLISVVSEAKPNIANYHFTTLTPVLGVVRRGEGLSFVMADIPGLIEGAWEGKGLGHQFLRHVERCRILVHIVDVSGSEGRDPKEDFETINRELKRFNPELSERPMLVAGNKCDLAEPGQIEEFRSFIEGLGYRFFPMIAPINEQVDPLLDAITAELSKLPPILRYEPDPVELRPLEELDRGAVTVTEEDGVFSVEAQWLLRIMRTVDFDDSESLQYFQRVLIDTGVIDALREAGCGEGDTVDIYGLEFDFVD